MLTRCTRVLASDATPTAYATDPAGQRAPPGRRLSGTIETADRPRPGSRARWQASMEAPRDSFAYAGSGAGGSAAGPSRPSFETLDPRAHSIPVAAMQAIVMRLHRSMGPDHATLTPGGGDATSPASAGPTPKASLDGRFQAVQKVPPFASPLVTHHEEEHSSSAGSSQAGTPRRKGAHETALRACLAPVVAQLIQQCATEAVLCYKMFTLPHAGGLHDPGSTDTTRRN